MLSSQSQVAWHSFILASTMFRRQHLTALWWHGWCTRFPILRLLGGWEQIIHLQAMTSRNCLGGLTKAWDDLPSGSPMDRHQPALPAEAYGQRCVLQPVTRSLVHPGQYPGGDPEQRFSRPSALNHLDQPRDKAHSHQRSAQAPWAI